MTAVQFNSSAALPGGVETAPDRPASRSGQTVVDLLEAAADRHADAVAVRFKSEGLTYRELEELTNRWARYLLDQGIGPGDRIGISLVRSPQLIVGLLAVLKIGAAYVPLDPSYPQKRLGHMVADSGAGWLLTERQTVERFRGFGRNLLVVEDMSPRIRAMSGRRPCPQVTEDLPAYLIYTSGSTGRPKGVVISHRALSAFVRAAGRLYAIDDRDRVLQFATINFDAAVEEIFITLTAGATLVLRTDEMLAPVGRFLAHCRRWGVTVLDLPTAYWHLLAEQIHTGEFPAGIRLVIVGGEAVRPDALGRWQRKVGGRVRLLNTYGPTETTVVVAASELGREPCGSEIPIGYPLSGVQTLILDPQRMPVAEGESGELYIGGPQVAEGYLNRPRLTAERFVKPPSPGCGAARPAATLQEAGGNRPAEGWQGRFYKTGDRVRRRSDGQLIYLGRLDRQIKVRGYRVELDEIEAELSRHPDLRFALVDGRPDSGGRVRLVAYYAPVAEDKDPKIALRLKQWCRDRLPAFMQPEIFVPLEGPLPVTPGGKVDYRALPRPGMGIRDLHHSTEPLRNETERRLKGIWQQVLGVETVERSDRFFDLGGNSLLAVTLLGLVEKAFGKSIPLKALSQAATLADMAEVLRNGPPERSSALETIQPFGERLPLFFVCATNLIPALALSSRWGTRQPVYGLNVSNLKHLKRLRPLPSPATLARWLLGEIEEHHPKGPYLLGGYCLGAKIAYEMAHQLRDSGQTVAALFMIDAVWRPRPRFGRFQRHRKTLSAFGPAYILKLLKERWETSRRPSTSRVLEQLRLKRMSPDDEFQRQRIDDAAFLNDLDACFEDYVVRPYSAAVTTIFNSEWRIRYAPESDWLAAAASESHVIHGFHDHLFRSPQLEQVAEIIANRVARIEGSLPPDSGAGSTGLPAAAGGSG